MATSLRFNWSLKIIGAPPKLLAPNSPAIVGKSEVGPWVAGYFEAYSTQWEKTTLEFVVSGDWAFERYAYKVVDTPRSGGDAVADTGNGINIYHLDADGTWRVARDAWVPTIPACGCYRRRTAAW